MRLVALINEMEESLKGSDFTKQGPPATGRPPPRRYVVFQLAEVAVPQSLFADILRRIDDLRPKPPLLPA